MGRRFTRGRKAKAVSQRSGADIPYKRLVREPGTGLLIDRRESDGRYNLVDHPQNFPPREKGEAIALREPNPEYLPYEGPLILAFNVSLSGGAAKQLFLSQSDQRPFAIPEENIPFTSTVIIDGSIYTASNEFQLNARINEALAFGQTVSTT